MRRGVDFAQAEAAIKIRSKYLRALEDDQFELLPAETYVKGFLRTYADYLGLDGDVYVDEYASRFITSWRDELPPQRERQRIRRRERPVSRLALALVLVGIVAVTALVFAAWRYGGSSPQVPGLIQHKHQHHAPARQLVLRGVGQGTYVEVRRGKATGKVDLQGTVGAGEVDRLAGSRFYLLVRRPAGLHITLNGRAVALPAVHNLRVLVTPQQTTRLSG